MYEKIETEYNRYISSKVKNCKKTEFMKKLAKMIGTTLSNIYKIIKSGMITTLDYNLNEIYEFNANTAWNKRTTKSIESNASKRVSSKSFIELVLK